MSPPRPRKRRPAPPAPVPALLRAHAAELRALGWRRGSCALVYVRRDGESFPQMIDPGNPRDREWLPLHDHAALTGAACAVVVTAHDEGERFEGATWPADEPLPAPALPPWSHNDEAPGWVAARARVLARWPTLPPAAVDFVGRMSWPRRNKHGPWLATPGREHMIAVLAAVWAHAVPGIAPAERAACLALAAALAPPEDT